jgi:hypothetical protein
MKGEVPSARTQEGDNHASLSASVPAYLLAVKPTGATSATGRADGGDAREIRLVVKPWVELRLFRVDQNGTRGADGCSY